MNSKKAIIYIDLQNDFCPGGSLAVPDGDSVIPVANELQHFFDVIVVTKDWHPKNHMSFASHHPNYKIGDVIPVHGIQQILWPDHCVQGTKGAELHPKLLLNKIDHIVHKGIQPEIDSYSAFFDNEHLRSTELADYLHKKNITDIYIMGLATDYCVKYSCLDAVNLGFNVYMIQEGCRGVDLQKGDVNKAVKSMSNAGVNIVSLFDIKRQ